MGIEKDMNRGALIEQLILHEGLKLKPYKDTKGLVTIGVGRCLDRKGITRQEAYYLLENDIAECLADLNNNLFPDFFLMPEKIQLVLADMRFNLGSDGFKQFKKMIAAIKRHDWSAMATEMQASSWAKQVKDRAKQLTDMVLSVPQ
jgi:lysozyme